MYDGGNLLLQFADKLSRVVSLVLYVAQFLLPYSRQLTALEQFLLDEVDEFDACSRSHEVFSLPSDIVPLEQRLYDACPRRWSADAVLFERRPQFLVVNELSCRFHCPEQRCLGVVFRRCGPFLRQRRRVFSALALFKCRQRALLVLRLGVAVVGSLPVGSVLGIHRPPSRIENQFSGGFEFYAVHIAHHCCSGELAVGIEHADEAPGYQVVDVAFHVGESLCRHSGGYYGVVVGHFARVEHLFRLLQRFSPQCREELVVALYAVQYSSAFGIDVVAQILCVHTGVCSQLALI